MTILNPNGYCECGQASFEITGQPLIRAICHCTICQEFNQADFGDVTIFREKSIVMPAKEKVKFTSFAFPPMVQRGKCVECQKPAIEYLTIPPFPKLMIVPSANISDKTILPEPSLHIFYHSRVADVEDELPKKSGYLKSQLSLCSGIAKALL